MCGILLAFGKNAETYVKEHIQLLQHRGPDSTTLFVHGENMAVAFVRLAINDLRDSGEQPLITEQFVSVFNGEIYNHEELRENHQLKIDGLSDTHVISSLFSTLGENVIDVLDGFYAGLIYSRASGRLFALRDYIGKKNLFLVRSGELTLVTSELKAITDVDSFVILPKGVCEVDLENCQYKLIRSHQFDFSAPQGSLQKLVTEAVRKRVPSHGELFGVFLSGGLDSSIIASIVNQLSQNAVYYILGDEGSEDSQYVSHLIESLGLSEVQFVPLPTDSQLDELISSTVYATESYNPSIISNGIGSSLLAARANSDGIKVVLVGEGADELFCGYHTFREDQEWNATRRALISDMYFTELRRIDMACMQHSIEARCPFLDRQVYIHSETLSYHDFYQNNLTQTVNKYALREAFKTMLPEKIYRRKKTSLDVGSGMRQMVVEHLHRYGVSEQQALLSRWKQFFSMNHKANYFHSYPVFSETIAKRGVRHKYKS